AQDSNDRKCVVDEVGLSLRRTHGQVDPVAYFPLEVVRDAGAQDDLAARPLCDVPPVSKVGLQRVVVILRRGVADDLVRDAEVDAPDSTRLCGEAVGWEHRLNAGDVLQLIRL